MNMPTTFAVGYSLSLLRSYWRLPSKTEMRPHPPAVRQARDLCGQRVNYCAPIQACNRSKFERLRALSLLAWIGRLDDRAY